MTSSTETLNSFSLHGSNKEGVSGIEIDAIFYDLQMFALDGCTYTENVAQNYRKRPCFKKIEQLLSRLKHELNIHHNIVSNINSQGTAWVVKDFIFAFTRIINAWTIMRGYVYDKAESLDDLRSEFDPDFIGSFSEWQKSTLKMMKSLMTSIENMDASIQNKSGNKQKKRDPFVHKGTTDNVYDHDLLKDFQKDLFAPKIAPNSEQIQIRNHNNHLYFRPGVLQPLTKDSCQSSSIETLSPSTPSSDAGDMFNWMSCDDMSDSATVNSSERLYNRGRSVSLPTTPIDAVKNPFDFMEGSRAKQALMSKFNSFGTESVRQDLDMEDEFRRLELELDVNCDVSQEDNLKNMYKEDAQKITYLMSEIVKLPQTQDLAGFVNIVNGNINSGRYGKLADIIQDLRNLGMHVKSLMKNANETEKIALKIFVAGLDGVINRKAFE